MSKQIIHFAHANGFPAKTYSRLFSFLEPRFELQYLNRHGHNPDFPVTDGWHALRDELRTEIETKFTRPVIGLGHSLGGILHLLVAIEKPDLYTQIVLLDAPIRRLNGAYAPTPYSPPLEKAMTPQVEDVVRAIRELSGE